MANYSVLLKLKIESSSIVKFELVNLEKCLLMLIIEHDFNVLRII